MEKVTINKIERLKITDSKGLSSRDIKRKFGKRKDYFRFFLVMASLSKGNFFIL